MNATIQKYIKIVQHMLTVEEIHATTFTLEHKISPVFISAMVELKYLKRSENRGRYVVDLSETVAPVTYATNIKERCTAIAKRYKEKEARSASPLTEEEAIEILKNSTTHTYKITRLVEEVL